MCKIHHDKRTNKRTTKTMNINGRKQKKTGRWRLDNGTVDNVSNSKIHHDKRVNECTIGTTNTRWKKTKKYDNET